MKNNLPGTPEFCPLVFRTEALESFIRVDLAKRAKDIVADVPRNILARTAAFLLLKDSRSSYAIEGERPPQDRIQRWGRAIGEAGYSQRLLPLIEWEPTAPSMSISKRHGRFLPILKRRPYL